MSLAIDYCKELAKELRKSPVYIPGTNTKPGDIIEFSDTNWLGVPKPWGSFKTHGNLSDLQINIPTQSESDDQLDSYVYASKGSVNVSFKASAQAGDIGKGNLRIGFTKEGSTYLSAVDCRETRLNNIIGLEGLLSPHKEKLNWANLFIVISVTVAKKALIMQSSTNQASLEIDGSVKDLTPSGNVIRNLNADLNLSVTAYNEASFIKDWSSNVAVFFSLIRYKKRFLGDWDISSRKLSSIGAQLAESGKEDPYEIQIVDPYEGL